MVVLCDGMFRSGSTWSYNVALQLVRSCCPHRKAYGLYSENPAVVLAAARPRISHLIIKSHILDPSAYELCRAGSIKAIYTWRHPYDAIVSAVGMFGYSVDYWIDRLQSTLRIWSFHRSTGSAYVISYDSIVSTPAASVSSIADYLGLNIQPEQASHIAEAMSAEQVKTFSQQIDELEPSRVVRRDGLVYDRQTLLHQNHIRDGRIGHGAGVLDPEKLAVIDALLQEEGFGFLCKTVQGVT
jgi:hypothetical protein